MLHLVDLDGARLGKPVELSAIAAVARGVAGHVRCEAAGGLRTSASVADAIGAGIDRVVIGTRALAEPAFVGELVARHGAARVVVALDVRDGVALGDAWRQGAAGVVPGEALLALAETGVKTFEVTAIDRDGRMEGPDLALLGGLVALDRGQIIASGGIRSVDDLRAVRDVGCSGAIVGRALYEGGLDLAEAIAAFG